MLILTDDEVDGLVEPEAAITLAQQAYRAHAQRRFPVPVRLSLTQAEPPGGALLLAGFGDGPDLVVKSNIHGWPHGSGAPRRTASLLTLWDLRAAKPLALLAAAAFNDHRTAAGLAAAARVLARPDSKRLALFGAGKIARGALATMTRAFPIEDVRIVSRDADRARLLAGSRARVLTDAAEAVRDADIILCATSSDRPVFPGDAVPNGAVVLLAGATRGDAREADDALMRRALVWADDAKDALEKGGDIRLALTSGALEPARWMGEIGALRAQPASSLPRVFKSIGIAAQDLLLARHVVARAEAHGVGLRYEMFPSWVGPP